MFLMVHRGVIAGLWEFEGDRRSRRLRLGLGTQEYPE